MIAALLLIAAAAEPQPAMRLQAVATARIVAGERLRLDAQDIPASAQRTRIRVPRRAPDEPVSELRLIEFQ